ncbi:unnamed protein product [Cylicostephanus goldi]|uniref:Uncharacterized protein n=1 Tax=Cylicostephanus goldi TaxID=71465 RepID=A0A3P6S9H6_CYLGO|nr:unnamed protein product [Cylicostephanus goldi]
MSSANAGKAGRDTAMRLALSDRYKGKGKGAVEKSNNVVKVEDAHPDSSATAISQPNNVPQAVNAVNGANVAVNEVSSIPGTVPVPVAYGETPILDHVPAPSLPEQQTTGQVAPVTPEQPVPAQNPLAHKTASHQSLTVTEQPKPAIPPSAFSAPTVGNVVSIPAEISTPRPVAPPLSSSHATPPHITPPHATTPTASPLPLSSSATPLPAGAAFPHPVGGTSPHPANAASPHPAGEVAPPLPHPAHSAPPAPSFPVAVEVHRSNDPNEKKLPRTVSTQSVGVQPTIWESYKALGDVYSKQDNLGTLIGPVHSRLAHPSSDTCT